LSGRRDSNPRPPPWQGDSPRPEPSRVFPSRPFALVVAAVAKHVRNAPGRIQRPPQQVKASFFPFMSIGGTRSPVKKAMLLACTGRREVPVLELSPERRQGAPRMRLATRSRPPPSMPLQSRGMPVGRRSAGRSRGSRPLGPPPRCIQPQSPPARRQRVRRAGLDGSHPLTLQAKMLRASNS
jgi:hypothetical protein